MKRKLKRIAIKRFLILLLLIGICFVGWLIYKEEQKKQVPQPVPVEEKTEESKISILDKDTFINKYDNTSKVEIDEKIKKVITDYMDLYYRSMITLKVENLTKLFTDSDGNEAYLTEKATEFLINHHSMQKNDMKLSDAKYDINITKVTQDKDIITIEFLENDYLKFNYLKDVESKAYDVENTIVIKNTDDIYTIESLRVIQGYYIMFSREVNMKSSTVKTNIDKLYNNYIESAKKEVEENDKLLNTVNTTKYSSKQCDHEYDRDKAKEYANKYVDKRNSEYSAYDASGGNCQNFASQTVHAGGVPMDFDGTYQWKYYGTNVDSSNSEKGRTASWISTNSFYEYVTKNKGKGMCTDTDVNIFYGEPGDIVQVGYKGYTHTTVVVSQVTNDKDEITDLLINCNTVSLENYPLLGYTYPNKRLIKVLGYND